jgi:hypothetical protein
MRQVVTKLSGKNGMLRVSESQVVVRGFLGRKGQVFPKKKRNGNEETPSNTVHRERF